MLSISLEISTLIFIFFQCSSLQFCILKILIPSIGKYMTFVLLSLVYFIYHDDLQFFFFDFPVHERSPLRIIFNCVCRLHFSYMAPRLILQIHYCAKCCSKHKKGGECCFFPPTKVLPKVTWWGSHGNFNF